MRPVIWSLVTVLLNYFIFVKFCSCEVSRFDGWYNNPYRHDLGTVEQPFIYRVPPDYKDHVRQFSGSDRPAAGHVSYVLLKASEQFAAKKPWNAFFAFFGQIVAGEIVSATSSGKRACPVEKQIISVAATSDPPSESDVGCPMINFQDHMTRPYCFPDKFSHFAFFRAAFDEDSGLHINNPRKPINHVTSWIDASIIYGFDEVWSNHLRTFVNGTMRTNYFGTLPSRNRDRIPLLNLPSPNYHPGLANPNRLFALGNFKSNQNPPNLAFSIVWHLYHNYWAAKINAEFLNATDDFIFHRSRQFVTAVFQNIILYEYLPAAISGSAKIRSYSGYNSMVDPSVTIEFQAAAFRFGHSLVPSGFYTRTSKCFSVNGLCKFWWDSTKYFDEFNSDIAKTDPLTAIIEGMLYQESEKGDEKFSSGLSDNLFGTQKKTTRDLPAINIMRGRDVGLGTYNRVRKAYGLPEKKTLDEINPDYFDTLAGTHVLKNLGVLYNNSIDKLDLYVGGLIEATDSDGTGELFDKIILDQFLRLRDGDRFWFENIDNNIFNDQEIELVKSIKFKDVLQAVTNVDPSLFSKNESFFVNYESFKNCEDNVPRLVFDSDIECPESRSYDFFRGSGPSFIFVFIILGLIPFVCIGIGYMIYKHRSKTLEKLQKAAMFSRARIDTVRMRDTFMVYEKTGLRQQRKVQIRLGTQNDIQVLSKDAKRLRVIDINQYDAYVVKLTPESSREIMLLVRLPKDYDLVLVFNNVSERLVFMDSLLKYMSLHSKPVDISINEVEQIYETGVMHSDREKMLKRFFKTAFDQVYRAKSKPSKKKEPSLKRLAFTDSKKRLLKDSEGARNSDLLGIELNRDEFAQALALKPESIFVQQMFTLADRDHNGFISFAEFIDLLALMSKGDLQTRMQMLFDMYDFDGSGDLDEAEFNTMIKSLVEISNQNFNEEQVDNLAKQLLNDCEFDEKSTMLTFDKFFALVQRHQLTLWSSNLSFVKEAQKDRIPQEKIHSILQDKAPRDSLNILEEASGTRERKVSTGPSAFTMDVLEDEDVRSKSWMGSRVAMITHYVENHWNAIVILFVFLMVNCYLFINMFFQYAFLREHTGVRTVTGFGAAFSRGGAAALSFSFGCVLLAMCRNINTRLRDTVIGYYIPFDSAITFHRWAAYVAFFFSVVHIIGHAINFYHISTQPNFIVECIFPTLKFASDFMPKFHDWAFATVPGLTGIFMVILLSVMFVFATPTARRYIFQTFWFTHSLFPLVYVLIITHGASQLLQAPFAYVYLVGPIILFLIDWIISLRQKAMPMKIECVENLPSDVLHLQFKLPSNFSYTSGQWCRVSCDALNRKEYHPFTLTSAPYEKNLSVYIRGVGPWTKRMNQLCSKTRAESKEYPHMHLIGPFGSSNQDWYKFETVILVGAGIGVTPYASILKDLVHKIYTLREEISCRQVYFIWIARNHQQFEWFMDILREVEDIDVNGIIQIDIFVTQLLKDFDLRTMMLYICEHHFQRLSNRSLFTGLRAKTHFGRIDFQAYFNYVRRRATPAAKVGIFSCGPKSVITAVNNAAKGINETLDHPLLITHYEIF